MLKRKLHECNICTENVSSVIKCYCEFEACNKCFERYILSKNEYAQCMSCNKIFDRGFLMDNFTKQFVNGEYKRHKEVIIYEKELSYLPIAQLQLEKKTRKLYINNALSTSVECENIMGYCTRTLFDLIKNDRLKKIKIDYKIEFTNSLEQEKMKCINMLNYLKKEFSKEMGYIEDSKLSVSIRQVKRYFESHCDAVPKEKIVKQFTRQCPNNDCRGFLSPNFYCGLCKITACGKCREIKDDGKGADGKGADGKGADGTGADGKGDDGKGDDGKGDDGKGDDGKHECNPGVLENIKFLEKDSKECPTCLALIFRISGCLQMFCTMCHSSFDWKTLQLETGVIHNPHYFEYQRQNGKNMDYQGGRPFCRQLDNEFIRNFTSKMSYCPEFIFKKLQNIYHIKFIGIAGMGYRHGRYDLDILNRDLHIKYLEKDINLDRFKVLVQQREKRYEKEGEIYDLIDMYTGAMSDVYFNLFDSFEDSLEEFKLKKENKNILEKYCKEMSQLDEYLKKHYMKIIKNYNSKMEMINIVKVEDIENCIKVKLV
jgi:hypothetical protein